MQMLDKQNLDTNPRLWDQVKKNGFRTHTHILVLSSYRTKLITLLLNI